MKLVVIIYESELMPVTSVVAAGDPSMWVLYGCIKVGQKAEKFVVAFWNHDASLVPAGYTEIVSAKHFSKCLWFHDLPG